MGPQKYLDWCGAARSGIGALEVHFPVKLTKMPLVNLRFTESQTRLKSSQNDIFHVLTSNLSHSKIFANFDQLWPNVES